MSVYFARSAANGLVKIGKANCVETRCKSLEHKHGCAFTLINVVDGSFAEERQAHKRFGPPSFAREYFEYRPSMLKWQPDAITPSKASKMLQEWLQREGRFASWLAAQVQADRSTVSQWLNGHRAPHPGARARLAAVTGLPVDNAEAWG